MNWVGDFFRAIPDVFVALWEFGEAWEGVAVTLGSVVLAALFCAGAYRLRDEMGWVSAMLGSFAAFILAFWAFGILPSAWIYFMDGDRPLLEGTIVPEEIVIGELEVATNFYEVFRDSVVMGETFIAMGALAYLAIWIQKRFPRGLAPGEEKQAATGGYK